MHHNAADVPYFPHIFYSARNQGGTIRFVLPGRCLSRSLRARARAWRPSLGGGGSVLAHCSVRAPLVR